MVLRTLDVLVLLKIMASGGQSWTQCTLAEELSVSQSQIHDSLKRAKTSLLFSSETKRIYRAAFAEFLVHGVKYAYPAIRGGPIRGILTVYAAPSLRDIAPRARIVPPPVWPHPDGTAKGTKFEPLDKRAPDAALRDPELYELLALVDAIRDGKPKETELAVESINSRFGL